MDKSVPSIPDASRAAEVRAHLEKLLSDFALSGASRRARLLRYLVESALDDRTESMKESVIATEVFDRPPDYDPQIDSVVRVEVGRLRARLAEYYEKSGASEPVRIEIPRGGYRPVFVFRDNPPEPVPERRSNWKWIVAGIAAIAVIAAAIVFWRTRSAAPPTPTAVAVLPFLNLSGNPGDEYLADGISEELTEVLAEYNDLRVVSRTSAFQYKGKSADVREIGQNLRAGAVLEGSIAKQEGQFRVIAQLIRTSDGYHLWSHTYETSLADLTAVEAGIAQATKERLASSSKPGAPEVAVARNPEAHDLYMRAVYEFDQRTEASTRRAMDLARQSSEKDPSFAAPFVVMAAAESQLVQYQAEPSREAGERAWEYAGKALALDPSNSAAHAQRALMAYTNQWDWPQAEREFKLALAGGSHGSAENLYGWCLITRGRFAEARRRLQTAAELDPLSLGPQLNQVEELMEERSYPEGKRRIDQILQTAPSNGIALGLAVSIAFWQQDCSSAQAASAKLLELYPKASAAIVSRSGADYVCGHRDEANAAMRGLGAHPAGYVSPYALAGVEAFGSNADRAVFYLEKSAELREPRLMMLRYDRIFDPIRTDPRVIAIQKKLGLPE